VKYRKKPIVIEAFQMTPARRWDNSEWPDWLNRAWNGDGSSGTLTIKASKGNEDGARLVILTIEGAMDVEWYDWIIQGIKGELYPCKPDIFDATYEVVEQTK
jgi:hypothetical protein